MAINRKDFLKTMGGLAALTIIPRRVLGGPGHIAPNDQLTKGIIGMGGIGFSANHFSSNEQCRLVAVCDCDDNHLQKGVRLSKERLNEEVKGYHLYRDLINDPKIIAEFGGDKSALLTGDEIYHQTEIFFDLSSFVPILSSTAKGMTVDFILNATDVNGQQLLFMGDKPTVTMIIPE